MSSILVIATGGLGPFVHALGALAALRIHHRDDQIVLLTAPETTEFAVASRQVDDVWAYTPPDPWDFPTRRALRARLHEKQFSRVYDLDGGVHGKRLFHLMYGRWIDSARRATLPWCGDIPGTAGFYPHGARGSVHVRDRMEAQLVRAGVPEVPPTDLTWVARQVTSFKIPFRMTDPFVLLSCDPADVGRGDRETVWPIERWTMLGAAIAEAGMVPLLTGLAPNPDLREAVAAGASRALDLTGRASISDLVFLAWAAKGAVGADNGLMHLFATAGCRAVVLYDAQSDPARGGQRGRDVTILRRATLADIPVGEVVAALRRRT